MDIVDNAQQQIEQTVQRALAENRAKFVGPDVDFLECQECGAEIPAERRAAIHNCHLCVHCQAAKERR